MTSHGRVPVEATSAGARRLLQRLEWPREADGMLRLSTYSAFDGVPAGDYAITVELRKPFFTPEGAIGPNLLPAKYANPKTSGLTFTVKPGNKQLDISLAR